MQEALSPKGLSPHMRCMAMEESSPSSLCRSSSLPSRPSPSMFNSSSSSISITRLPCPSSLLQRRTKASQGLAVKTVNANTTAREPSPPPPPPPSPPLRSEPPTAYDILHISPSASQQDIKTAYWRLARQHHPDKVPFERKEASTLVFLQIHSAYIALKDPEARARYDLQMSMKSFQSSGYKQKFSGMPMDVKAPRFYTQTSASPNPYMPRAHIHTPIGATVVASGIPFQFYTSSAMASATPRSHYYTPKSATATTAASPNYFMPRSPYTTGRSWETDQCW